MATIAIIMKFVGKVLFSEGVRRAVSDKKKQISYDYSTLTETFLVWF